MIILTAGHTGPNTGAQCATTQFDEGAETLWLRNRVAEILTNKYGLVVLIDNDTASLQLLTQSINAHTHSRDVACYVSSATRLNNLDSEASSSSKISTTKTSEASTTVDRRPLTSCDKREQRSLLQLPSEARNLSKAINVDDIIIDLHFNAHSNPNARGTETIVSDNATDLELRMASRLAHTTSDALNIPLRGIKSESQTPHHRLAMLHLTPQSIILEVCFCTSPEDVEQYRRHRRKIANTLAKNIAELILDRKR